MLNNKEKNVNKNRCSDFKAVTALDVLGDEKNEWIGTKGYQIWPRRVGEDRGSFKVG